MIVYFLLHPFLSSTQNNSSQSIEYFDVSYRMRDAIMGQIRQYRQVYYLNNLRMSIFQGDSFLSSLSIASAIMKPQDSQIFQLSALPFHMDFEQNEQFQEVKIDDIAPEEFDMDQKNCFSHQSSKRDEKLSSSASSNIPILPQFTHHHFNQRSWIITDQGGVSQDDDSIQIPLITKKTQDPLPKIKNQTKNIPKNFGKAIICFMEKNRNLVTNICMAHGVSAQQFLADMLLQKKHINTIADLRRIWSDYRYAKCARIISNIFFRQHCLAHIFNSRICSYSSHIKYRFRLSQAIKDPFEFRHIKDY